MEIETEGLTDEQRAAVAAAVDTIQRVGTDVSLETWAELAVEIREYFDTEAAAARESADR